MPSSPEQLHTLFQQQIVAVEKLLKAMHAENDALVQRDFDALQASTAAKSELTQSLEELGALQQAFLAKNGQRNSVEGMDAYIAAQTKVAAQVLEQEKTKLHSLLEKCQTTNLISGNIIAASRQSAETALAILRGQLPSENVLYTAGGQAVADNSRDPLTKA